MLATAARIRIVEKGFCQFCQFALGENSTLHSLTHSGVRQLHGRFDGNDVVASYPTEGIRALIASWTSAAFVVTLLVARHFRFETEEIQASRLWNEYCSLTLNCPVDCR